MLNGERYGVTTPNKLGVAVIADDHQKPLGRKASTAGQTQNTCGSCPLVLAQSAGF